MAILLKGLQLYSWGVFAAAWLQMGYVDWSEQKIRNRFLKYWLLAIAAPYVLLALQTVLGRLGLIGGFALESYYGAALGYLAVSCLAAYALWGLRVWPAGDVKLFILLSLFYPLMRFPPEFRQGLRFIEVLINVFIPAALFVFTTALLYLWRTRLAHLAGFFRALGPLRLPGYFVEKVKETSGAFVAELAAFVRYYRDPRALVVEGGAWLASMLVMSMVTYWLSDIIRSNFLRTILCFALFFGWSRFCMQVGRWRALGGAFAVFALVLWRSPSVDWSALGRAFSHISVFSLCIFFGIQLAFKVVAGQTAYMVLPVFFLVWGLIPWWRLKRWIMGASLPALPELPAAPDDGGTLVLWAAMGLFFGASLVCVRIWDAESFESVEPRQIKPYMTLGPAIVALIEADEEFRDEHFPTFYADGLTPAQAEALRDWCEENGVMSVPLAPTISFANWIFFGYFLTLMIDGHVLAFAYR